MNTFISGRRGEDIAAKYLSENGYIILKRNFSSSGGEIDIIAKKGQHLAFVEVKTRRNNKFGSPSEAVNRHKIRKIIQCAKAYIMCYNDYEDISFDVCEVYTEDRFINYIENAFSDEVLSDEPF